MKKSILALAVLGSFAGVAAAQSSVTLFGVVDVAARYTAANGKHVYALATDGNTSSRLGVRGVEDLGGGLKAGFWLEGRLSADSGTVDTTRFWGRRATISLISDSMGELRLGRFKSSAQLAIEDFDPVSTTGLGSAATLISKLGGTDYTRYDNMVTYVLPGKLGGFYGSVDVAAGEGAGTGKMFGARGGYKVAALNVSAAYMETGVSTKVKFMTLGASYDFGMVKPSVIFTSNEFGSAKQEVVTVAASAPLGAGSVWGSYTMAKDKSATASTAMSANQISAGYVYNLSKRTALYTTVSLIDNDKKAKYALGNGTTTATVPNLDARMGGFDVGVRHSF